MFNFFYKTVSVSKGDCLLRQLGNYKSQDEGGSDEGQDSRLCK